MAVSRKQWKEIFDNEYIHWRATELLGTIEKEPRVSNPSIHERDFAGEHNIDRVLGESIRKKNERKRKKQELSKP